MIEASAPHCPQEVTRLISSFEKEVPVPPLAEFDTADEGFLVCQHSQAGQPTLTGERHRVGWYRSRATRLALFRPEDDIC